MTRKKRKKKVERKAPSGTITGKAKRNDWQTPELLLGHVRAYSPDGEIHLDPATAPGNPTRARRFYAPAPRSKWKLCSHNGGEWTGTNGLRADWLKISKGGLVFVNPPYGEAAGGVRWLEKIGLEGRRGCHMVALISCSRFEQSYLTATLREANAVCFPRGRVAFRNPDTGDEVPGGAYASMFVGFNVTLWRWRRAFESLVCGPKLREAGERSACFELRPL